METFEKIATWVVGTVLTLLVLFLLAMVGSSIWHAATRTDAEALAAQTPHVISEAEGCKVFAFEANGRDHYFTRCGDTVTTDRNYTVSCGKNCTRHETETIVTKNNH